MIISRAEIESAVSAYRVGFRRKNAVTPLDALRSVDTFEDADNLGTLGALREAVANEPFYRPKLVEDLRRRVSEGRYYVPADQIVEKMLGRLVAEAIPA